MIGSGNARILVKGMEPEPEMVRVLKDDWLDVTSRPRIDGQDSFDETVDALLAQQKYSNFKSNHVLHQSLLRYSFVGYLFLTRHSILSVVSWQSILPSAEDVCALHNLPDMCKDIRSLFHVLQPVTDLCKFLQFSLPFVKHNRMSFPVVNNIDTYVDMSRLIFASCSGIYPDVSKKPTWLTQVKLTGTFWKLLSYSNCRDIVGFCSSNSSVLRLSLFENFLYNITYNMPADHDYVFQREQGNPDLEHMKRSLFSAIDQFRLETMQSDCLDWGFINDRALLAVEKCNRLCRITQILDLRKQKKKTSVNVVSVRHAFDLPCVASPLYLAAIQPCVDVQRNFLLESVLHNSVQTYSLPANLHHYQMRTFKHHINTERHAALTRSCLHICLRCKQTSIENLGAVRVVINDSISVVCGLCNRNDFMLRCFVPGKLLRFEHEYFYWCTTCLKVHVWNGVGNELYGSCLVATASSKRSQNSCIVCERTQQVTCLQVLDDNIGVMQNVMLCNTHLPYEHSQRYIYNIPTLITAILNKRKK